LHDLADALEISDGGNRSKTVHGADLRGAASGRQIDVGADLAADPLVAEGRRVPRREDQVPMANGRVEPVADDERCGFDVVAERGEPVLDHGGRPSVGGRDHGAACGTRPRLRSWVY